jgi:hypothetical protein
MQQAANEQALAQARPKSPFCLPKLYLAEYPVQTFSLHCVSLNAAQIGHRMPPRVAFSRAIQGFQAAIKVFPCRNFSRIKPSFSMGSSV